MPSLTGDDREAAETTSSSGIGSQGSGASMGPQLIHPHPGLESPRLRRSTRLELDWNYAPGLSAGMKDDTAACLVAVYMHDDLANRLLKRLWAGEIDPIRRHLGDPQLLAIDVQADANVG